MPWGDKGEEYRPDKCKHEPDDGCCWCCERCNKDFHMCPKCGTISDHKESPCDPCIIRESHNQRVVFEDEWLTVALQEWFEVVKDKIAERHPEGFRIFQVKYELTNWGAKVDIHANVGFFPLRLRKPEAK